MRGPAGDNLTVLAEVDADAKRAQKRAMVTAVADAVNHKAMKKTFPN
jgi:hypothetical protein